jgi:aminoglycoside/choline kinase family phosphotransferase
MRTQDELVQAVVPRALEISGGSSAEVTTMTGDASSRRYHRVTVPGGKPASLVVMELPDDPLKSDEASKAKPTELPFLNVYRYLKQGGVAVPEIYRDDTAKGFLYLEDLGDVTLESVVLDAKPARRREHYEIAIDNLVALQHFADKHPDPSCIAFSRSFDYDLLLWELHHFKEWLFEADRGAKPSSSENDTIEEAFRGIAKTLADQPRGFVHRDYQSRNLMVQDGPRLRVIDFQDALMGTAVYDLVALLRDSYVELEPELLDELLSAYAQRAGIGDRAAFRRLFDLQTTQRKLKDAGRFVFIDRVKKNPKFLPSIPASLRYVRDALARQPELAPLRKVLGKYVPELS